eukprot:NODE_1012_length_1510_cov_262.763557_g1001_i0.p1 GENE.NODE_1012_length_1510_cov_262.763557_g1001_i0~~NODE_1012_length_1510_cov_262.763557_g1001_i0.p1  ORF type:complete len:474 (+),score=75.65 NODE_1012_length_1510_cov_262.763557_g1001_i0:85-1422(+)
MTALYLLLVCLVLPMRAETPWHHLSTAFRRQQAGAVVIDEMVYLVGGKYRGSPQRLMDRYDPATDSWTRMEDMRVARFGAMVHAVGSKIYVIGGNDGALPLSTVEVYDTVSHSWAELAPMPTARWAGGVMSVSGSADTHLIVFGGHGAEGIMNTMEQLSVAAGGNAKWTTLDHPMPMARAEFAYAQKLNSVYVIGGRVLGDSLTNSVAEYDAIARTWQGITDLPAHASGGAATLDDESNLIVVGGQVPYTDSDEVDTSSLWMYSPTTAAWTSMPAHTSLHGASAATVGGRLYVFGGAHGTTELDDVVEFDADKEGGEYLMHNDDGSVEAVTTDPEDSDDDSHHPVLITLGAIVVSAGVVYLAYGFVQRWRSGARTAGELVGDKRADEVWDSGKKVAEQAAEKAGDLLTKARAKAGGFAPVPAVDEDEIEEIVMDAQNVPNGYGSV